MTQTDGDRNAYSFILTKVKISAQTPSAEEEGKERAIMEQGEKTPE